MKTYKNYVNNEWVGGAGSRDIVNPATGEAFAVVPEAGKADVDRAVQAAREAFDNANWRDSSLAMARGRVLFKLAELVRKNAARLAELETQNSGKPIVESEFDMTDVATCFEYFGGLATKIHGETLHVARQRAQFHLARAGRRGGAHHPVELPAADGGVETRPGARRGLHGHPQAR